MRKLLFFLSFCSATLFAQDVKATPTYLIGSHTFGEGVGYDSGFSTIEALSFLTFCKRNYWPFLDLQFHFFDDRQIAGNAGIGFRHCLYNSPRIIGFNAYYDFRRSEMGNWYNQVGFGFEIFSSCFDFRFNAYIPFDREHVTELCVFDQYADGYVVRKKLIETAFRGFSLEFGAPFCLSDCIFSYFSLGGYFYKDTLCETAMGGYLKNFFYFKDVFFLEGRVSYDPLFETRFQGRVGISIPIGKCYQKCGNCLQYWPVYRSNIIVLDEFCKWKWDY